jgi:sulfide:quinone oxidoreductase
MLDSSGTRPPDARLQVVVVGGGVAAAELVIALRTLARDAVGITLLCPEDELTYRPLSVRAPFERNGKYGHPVARLASDFGANRVKGSLAWVAPSAHRAFTPEGRTLSYDVLAVATGARREPAFPHALTFRGYEDSDEMRALLGDIEEGRASRIAFVATPGPGWSLPIYELALMTAHRAAERSRSVSLTIVTPEERPLAMFGRTASDEVAKLIGDEGIVFEGMAFPDVPEAGRVVLEPGGRELSCDRVVALPRLRGPAIRGLPADEDGFLPTTPFGHVIGVKDVYAAGDGTSFPIKQGGVACQQADVVAQVIARRAGADVTPTGYRPTLRGVLLTGGHPRWLRHDAPRHGEETSDAADHFLWWPPSKVAGDFLAPYLGEAVAYGKPGVAGRAVISKGREGGRVELVTLPQAESAR